MRLFFYGYFLKKGLLGLAFHDKSITFATPLKNHGIILCHLTFSNN
jgi:hypothetical protein